MRLRISIWDRTEQPIDVEMIIKMQIYSTQTVFTTLNGVLSSIYEDRTDKRVTNFKFNNKCLFPRKNGPCKWLYVDDSKDVFGVQQSIHSHRKAKWEVKRWKSERQKHLQWSISISFRQLLPKPIDIKLSHSNAIYIFIFANKQMFLLKMAFPYSKRIPL